MNKFSFYEPVASTRPTGGTRPLSTPDRRSPGSSRRSPRAARRHSRLPRSAPVCRWPTTPSGPLFRTIRLHEPSRARGSARRSAWSAPTPIGNPSPTPLTACSGSQTSTPRVVRHCLQRGDRHLHLARGHRDAVPRRGQDQAGFKGNPVVPDLSSGSLMTDWRFSWMFTGHQFDY